MHYHISQFFYKLIFNCVKLPICRIVNIFSLSLVRKNQPTYINFFSRLRKLMRINIEKCIKSETFGVIDFYMMHNILFD
jgi:hypothetical protein